MSKQTKSKIIHFLIPGRLASGFILGCCYVLWLAIERKPIFDDVVTWVVDFINTVF